MMMRSINIRKGRAVPVKIGANWKKEIEEYQLGQFRLEKQVISQRDVIDTIMQKSGIKEKNKLIRKQLREQKL
jgi:hypothetical protein